MWTNIDKNHINQCKPIEALISWTKTDMDQYEPMQGPGKTEKMNNMANSIIILFYNFEWFYYIINNMANLIILN